LLPSWNKEFIIIIIIILGISIFIESNSIEKLVTFSWVF
jgi:cadmium resistance protein CadD (predicted permease)